MSTHKAVVIPINLEPHPNADKLSINRFGGYTTVLNTADWQGKTRGIFIEPDTIVDTKRPEFSFLDATGNPTRIKVKKLRGIYSMGLTIPTDNSDELGKDYWDTLGLQHYEPEQEFSTGGNWEKAPPLFANLSKYDVENLRKLEIRGLFKPAEMVQVRIKYNGSNVAYVFTEGKMYVRSRSGFRSKENNVFWQCLEQNPAIEKFCTDNPNVMVYGEVINIVKGFRYGLQPGQVGFRAFDFMLDSRQFIDATEIDNICKDYKIVPAELVGQTPFIYDNLLAIADMDSPFGDSINEGVVVKPLRERVCDNERVIGKLISNKYLDK